ncbi:DUF1127 domain-containing protein [Caenispirillum salinarum]|uniref:DUF1127 domain-containing protein n=1 Tax=Caenispirillum salinarum TaxID=859058 RepID=UPI001360B1A0|nr:DUF1127 domain-containing protein [Caenispirillum salinarum]
MSHSRCPTSPVVSRPASVAAIAPRLFTRLRAWLKERQDLKALLALDERLLRDIGLTPRALARHYRRRRFWW